MVGFLSIANDDAHPDFPVCLLQCIRAFFSVLAAPKCRERAQGPHQKASVSIESALPALLRLICSIRALEFFSLKNFPHLPCSILISSDMRRAVDCAENSAGRRRFEQAWPGGATCWSVLSAQLELRYTRELLSKPRPSAWIRARSGQRKCVGRLGRVLWQAAGVIPPASHCS